MKPYRILPLAPITLIASLMLISSCVSNKKYAEMQTRHDFAETELAVCKDQYASMREDLNQTLGELNHKENELVIKQIEAASLNDELAKMKQELAYLQGSNTTLLDRLTDLSVISKAGAESIQQSLRVLEERNEYIRELTTTLHRKDSVNLMLVMNLKRTLSSIDDEDVTVEVKKGVVYVSLSDKMLFQSGSAAINDPAKKVLGKIASVLNDHDQLDILVEGHTDNVPIGNIDCVRDNWDLSVKRSTAVVRVLEQDYGVDPARMTAGGRSEYVPKTSNDTPEGKNLNRRTEIVILPKLNEFFNLLEPQTFEKVEYNY